MKFIWQKQISHECAMLIDIALSDMCLTAQMMISDMRKCDNHIEAMDPLITKSTTTIQYGCSDKELKGIYSIRTEIDVNAATVHIGLSDKINEYLCEFWKDSIESGEPE